MGDGLVRSEKFRGVNWTLPGILGLLAITAVSIVPFTLTIFYLRLSDAHVIDMAGRQRMLLERHMKELLLAAEGVDSPYQRSLEILKERVGVLIHGGSTGAGIDQRERIVLPPAPTDEIRNKLLEQQRLLEAFVLKADRFLRIPRAAAEYRAVRDDVLKDNARLLEVSNDAVTMLTQHSESRVHTLIRWELVVMLLVVGMASMRTWRFLQAENALRGSQVMAMQALQQSDAVKSSLLSSVSHELRTPLTAIKTMLFNLHEDPDLQPPHVRKEFLKSIDEELDYLNRLVGNLLDMSRIEAGTLKPNREWHLMDELVEAAIRHVGQRLERRALQIELSQDLPPVYVDGVEIQQVFINLLDNAVKFSPEDSPIHIDAAVVGEAVEVHVTNEGEGIPSSELERIFDRFYRVSSGRAPATPGTGLGLAICKGFIEAHDGRIVARSIIGGETTLSFRLPLMKTVPAPKQEATHA